MNSILKGRIQLTQESCIDNKYQKLNLSFAIPHTLANEDLNGNMTIRESDHETGQDTTRSINVCS